MLSLSVVRSLVLRDYANCEAEHSNSIAKASLYLSKQPKWGRNKLAGNGLPYLVFVPTKEVMRDQMRLAAIARDIGMDFRGDLINGRLIYSWPGTGIHESACLPFPHISDAQLHQLHRFAKLSRGFFRIENFPSKNDGKRVCQRRGCLAVRLNKEFVEDMDKLTRVLAGGGWSVFKIKSVEEMYLYRKVDCKVQLQWDGSKPTPAPAFRVRELRLPELDLTSAPVETLEFILLMTDDLFYLTQKPPIASSRRTFTACKMKP